MTRALSEAQKQMLTHMAFFPTVNVWASQRPTARALVRMGLAWQGRDMLYGLTEEGKAWKDDSLIHVIERKKQ